MSTFAQNRWPSTLRVWAVAITAMTFLFLQISLASASVLKWTYQANPMVLEFNHNPNLYGGVGIPSEIANPFNGAVFSVDLRFLRLGNGPTTFNYQLVYYGRVDCGLVQTQDQCLTISSSEGIEYFLSNPAIGLSGVNDGVGDFFLNAVVNPDLSIGVGALGYVEFISASPGIWFGGIDRILFCDQCPGGYSVRDHVPFDYEAMGIFGDPGAPVPALIYAAPGGTWKLTVVPLPSAGAMSVSAIIVLIFLAWAQRATGVGRRKPRSIWQSAPAA